MKRLALIAALLASAPALAAKIPPTGALHCQGYGESIDIIYDTARLNTAIYSDGKVPPEAWLAYLADDGGLIISHDTPLGTMADEITPDGRWFVKAVSHPEWGMGWRESGYHCDVPIAANVEAPPFVMANPFAESRP
jgi:hypothetical protein